MTVRGGIADILEGVSEGRLFVAYSEGLHHVHAPGDRLPSLFQQVTIRAEVLDIPTYRAELRAKEHDSFKAAVIEDLSRRRDAYCFHDDEPVDASAKEPAGGSAKGHASPDAALVDAPRSTPDEDETDVARVPDVGDGVAIED